MANLAEREDHNVTKHWASLPWVKISRPHVCTALFTASWQRGCTRNCMEELVREGGIQAWGRLPCFVFYSLRSPPAFPGAPPELQLAWRLQWGPGHFSGAWEECAELWETACRLHAAAPALSQDGAFCIPGGTRLFSEGNRP